MKLLEFKVNSAKPVLVDGQEWWLEFPMSTVILLEEALGRSMRSPADWLRLETKEVPDVLRLGFTKRHPDEAEQLAAAICDNLPPEEIENVIGGLCEAACPKAMARLEEEIAKARERAKKGLALPNVPGVDVA